MSAHHVHYVDAAGDTVAAQFASSTEAWSFTRLCRTQDVAAGMPVADSWTCTVCSPAVAK